MSISPSTGRSPEQSVATSGHFSYRFYHFDIGGRIILAEDHECDGERAALALGKSILLASDRPKVEVWHLKQRVGILDKASIS
jgi:hypothetical protein